VGEVSGMNAETKLSGPEILDYFKDVVEDAYVTFNFAKQWKEEYKMKLLGYYPVYFPEEIAYAMGVLPIKLFGGVGRIEPSESTSRFQSFTCSIPKSILQLVMSGSLDSFDALAFTNICDVARNLAFVIHRNYGNKFRVIYLHYPINNVLPSASKYMKEEYERLINELSQITGNKYDPEVLRKYIILGNRKRQILRELLEIKVNKPWNMPFDELFTVFLASMVMPVDKFVELGSKYLEYVKGRPEEKPVERIRTVILGDFCEQPPLQLFKIIEMSGAYILISDYIKNAIWIGDIDANEKDPIDAMVKAYVNNPTPLTTRYHPAINKHEFIKKYVKDMNANAVIFLTPKFCEPSLYDHMIYRLALDSIKMPYVRIDYEEGMTSFEQPRTMAETFFESLLFEL
jgi:benzoyl-CoA reductase subunit C